MNGHCSSPVTSRRLYGDGQGAILEVVERDAPIRAGERLTLGDGSPVQVTGVDRFQLYGEQWQQTAHIGNMPD